MAFNKNNKVLNLISYLVIIYFVYKSPGYISQCFLWKVLNGFEHSRNSNIGRSPHLVQKDIKDVMNYIVIESVILWRIMNSMYYTFDATRKRYTIVPHGLRKVTRNIIAWRTVRFMVAPPVLSQFLYDARTDRLDKEALRVEKQINHSWMDPIMHQLWVYTAKICLAKYVMKPIHTEWFCPDASLTPIIHFCWLCICMHIHISCFK